MGRWGQLTCLFCLERIMRCDKCQRSVETPIIFESKTICLACYDHLHLPKLTLVRHWESNALYHPFLKKYMPTALNTLPSCGFALYNHKEFFSRNFSPSYRELLVFRYFGNVACKLINKNWPAGKTKCHCTNCP
jgi:hypothetical protein